jgi:hypothetical protein
MTNPETSISLYARYKNVYKFGQLKIKIQYLKFYDVFLCA